MLKKLGSADYETFRIGKRPYASPPKPVGCALRIPGTRSRYYAWGHPTENNCTFAEFKRIFKAAERKYRFVYHNAKFDLEVSEKWLGIPIPTNPDDFEDSMLLAYLHDPRSRNLKLKWLADHHLDMPPDEQTKLKDWIVSNIKDARETNWGEYIALAPGKLVGKYAVGDIVRTDKLFNKFYSYVKENGMLEAYNIEKQIIPISVSMEQKGVPINYKLLYADTIKAKVLRDKCMNAIKRKLGVKDFNPGAPTQVIPLFEKAGLVDPGDWLLTDKGNIRIGTESIAAVCNDKKVVANMIMHSKLTKVIGTYMEPWYKCASKHDVFYPWFSQTRSAEDRGTKSGRFSSNFQQTPREPDDKYKGLPFMRNYVIGDSSKHILLRRDFCQQEVRILAYYEEGDLYEAYLKNQKLDVHDLVGIIIEQQSGLKLPRITIKTCDFLVIYGGGVPALSEKLSITNLEAKKILKLHAKALPGVKDLAKEIQRLTTRGEPIYTIGGRKYYAEKHFEYRMVNSLIQGSAADHAKQSMIRIHNALQQFEDTRIVITVHDEFIVSTPYTSKKDRLMVMTAFRDAMDDDNLFKPIEMMSDGKWGKTWGGAVKCPI